MAGEWWAPLQTELVYDTSIFYLLGFLCNVMEYQRACCNSPAGWLAVAPSLFHVMFGFGDPFFCTRVTKWNRESRRKLFVTELLLAPKSDKLFRRLKKKKLCSLQVRSPTFCFAYQCDIAVLVNDHIGARWKIQNIWWH